MKRADFIKLAATQSFRQDEVELLHALLVTAQRGGSTSVLIRRAEVPRLLSKIAAMKATIERQKARRASVAGEIGTPDPNRLRRG